jgi:hypothetical protein
MEDGMWSWAQSIENGMLSGDFSRPARMILSKIFLEPSIVRRNVSFEPVSARNAQESQTQLDKNEGWINIIIQQSPEGIGDKRKRGKGPFAFEQTLQAQAKHMGQIHAARGMPGRQIKEKNDGQDGDETLRKSAPCPSFFIRSGR